MQKQADLQQLSFEQLCNGAFQEQANLALQNIARNIQDPNTDATKKRKLTITMELTPNKNRDLVTAKIQCKASLIPNDGIETQFFMSKDINSGEVNIQEYDGQMRGQMSLEDIAQPQREIPADCDPETGEVIEPEKHVIDFKKAAEC